MTLITRNTAIHNRHGVPVLGTVQRLVDDGRGNIASYRYHKTQPCPNCRRNLSDLSEGRGLCNWCGQRHTCSQCDAKCQSCSRRVCGRCRRGSVSDGASITVCPGCLVKHQRRQAMKDDMLRYQVYLQQQRITHQQQVRRAALRIQVARSHQNNRMAIRREANRMRLALMRNGFRRIR